ncbi:MAG TPA: N-acetyl-gamma-glutamyl-phosphate reductase [Sediminibacterium sp.]|nr:N-acetyl-gamma-glutamyl-phosphate reductase [Sediminibacterium sp.]
MKTIRAGIIGAAGYTGGEMLRILLRHPQVTINFAHSTSNAGNPVAQVHGDLLGDTDLHFTDRLQTDVDVLFLCVGHGDARKFLQANPIPDSTRIIDLSQDFRLQQHAQLGTRNFLYGLPELNKAAIASGKYDIANPGCFATCIQLGLLPLAKQGILQQVHTTGITGSTGAGQKLTATSHFSWRANNIQAYKSLQHQHLHEIKQSLHQLQGKGEISLYFVPWRGDFTRGIYVSSMINTELSEQDLYALYRDYYQDAAFTHISDTMIDLKQVVNTNKCLIHIEKHQEQMVVHTATDNLLKGASGQAVQNMNLIFGLPETTGLQLKAGFF